jgi:hypothetical protein
VHVFRDFSSVRESNVRLKQALSTSSHNNNVHSSTALHALLTENEFGVNVPLGSAFARTCCKCLYLSSLS